MYCEDEQSQVSSSTDSSSASVHQYNIYHYPYTDEDNENGIKHTKVHYRLVHLRHKPGRGHRSQPEFQHRTSWVSRPRPNVHYRSSQNVKTNVIIFFLFLFLNGCVTASEEFTFPDIKQGMYL